MADLASLPLDDVRSRRAGLQGDEVGLSYPRRLVQRRLEASERDNSARRRGVHRDIDALQAELTRRYRTGEADVESRLA